MTKKTFCTFIFGGLLFAAGCEGCLSGHDKPDAATDAGQSDDSDAGSDDSDAGAL